MESELLLETCQSAVPTAIGANLPLLNQRVENSQSCAFWTQPATVTMLVVCRELFRCLISHLQCYIRVKDIHNHTEVGRE